MDINPPSFNPFPSRKLAAVPSLSRLHFKVYGDTVILLVSDFVKFLNDNRDSSIDKKVITGNMIKILDAGHKSGPHSDLVTLGSDRYLIFEALLRYCLNHRDHSVCQRVCNEVTRSLLSSNTVNIIDCSMKDLYHTIIESTSFPYSVKLEHQYLGDVASKLPLLAYHLKEEMNISDSSWEKVLLFEWHFALAYPSLSGDPSSSTIIEKKFEYLKQCQTATELGSVLFKSSQHFLKSNKTRRAASDSVNGVVFDIASLKHTAQMLDESLTLEISRFTSKGEIGKLVSVGCGPLCKHHGAGLHVIIEILSIQRLDIDDLAALVGSHLAEVHNIAQVEVIFVKGKGILDDYFMSNNIHRFSLFDDLSDSSRRLAKSVLKRFPITFASIDQPESQSFCRTCFQEHQEILDCSDSLDIYSFNVQKEWVCHVPLIVQCVLEHTFFNPRYIAKGSPSYLKGKVAKLYNLLETGLNILNKDYRGILQDANTDELMLHYHQVTSVFQVTSTAGATASEHTGHRRLTQMADPDLCYYMTYIRKHPIKYVCSTDIEPKLHAVSMRDCHVIFMIDNLVRWSFRSDPKPGEERSIPIETLPITLKGLPKDSSVTEEWHLPSCIGSNCSCRDSVTLTKSDVDRVLFTLSDGETSADLAFNIKATWGIGKIWADLIASPDIQLAIEKMSPDCDASMTEQQLNVTVESLNRTLETLVLGEEVDDGLGIDDEDIQREFPCVVNDPDDDTLHHQHGDQNIITLDSSAKSPRRLLDQFSESEEVAFESDSDLTEVVGAGSETDSVDGFGQEFTFGFSDLGIEPIPMNDSDEGEVSDIESTEFPGIVEPSRPTIADTVAGHSCLSPVPHTGEIIESSDPNQLHVGPPCDSTKILSELSKGVSEDFDYLSSRAKKTPSSFDVQDMSESPITTGQPFVVHPTITRHPPPKTGRDDDLKNLMAIIDDLLVKLGAGPDGLKDRVLCAADYKLAKNLFLMKRKKEKYKSILCEVPLLHLRKSKITNLLTAYKDCGILHILKFMKDKDNENDWTKLVSISHIETATHYIFRLSVSLHLAFMITFRSSLEPSTKADFDHDIGQKSHLELAEVWSDRLHTFLTRRCEQSATFALHRDMMNHCDEIIALAVSERIGGPDGYNLLLSVLKSSLPFQFLNGASSYAGFCVQLLVEHHEAGHFHQSMKNHLFTTPYKDGKVNIALDTQREFDHREALKAFRPGAGLDAIVVRMSSVDHTTTLHNLRRSFQSEEEVSSHPGESGHDHLKLQDDHLYLNRKISATDMLHISRTVSLILRRGGLNSVQSSVPANVYGRDTKQLPVSILDRESFPCGNYLISKYICSQNLMEMEAVDIPPLDSVHGPKPLLAKIKSSKGVTIVRSKVRAPKAKKSEREENEVKRQQELKREARRANAMSSPQNACQAVTSPEGEKKSVSKSRGIKQALKVLLDICQASTESGLVLEAPKELPSDISENVSVVIVEFAGVKFKTSRVHNGREYIEHIQKDIANFNYKAPNMNHLIICEEKYSFTPDDFKAATRAKRTRSKKENIDITHLREGGEIISLDQFSQSSIVGTAVGRRLVSEFLGNHIRDLSLRRDLVLDLDCESNMSPCSCAAASIDKCSCFLYSTPIRAMYSRQSGLVDVGLLESIRQRKGEAEMSMVDWLFEVTKELGPDDVVLSYVTSADIDTVYIHLFTLSLFWPRNPDQTFKWQVYLWLQKSSADVMNITGVIEAIEHHYPDIPHVVATIAVIFCMGGNDFLPNFYGHTHEKWLKAATDHVEILSNLVQYSCDGTSGKVSKAKLDRSAYQELVKVLYCPAAYDSDKLSLIEVRQLTMKQPGEDEFNRDLWRWMPPASALDNIANLIDSQLEYLMTAGQHEADLPNFLGNGCLEKDPKTGQIFYNFGPDQRFNEKESLSKLLQIDEDVLEEKLRQAKKSQKQKRKRAKDDTPQKGARRKKKSVQFESTPIKMPSIPPP